MVHLCTRFRGDNNSGEGRQRFLTKNGLKKKLEKFLRKNLEVSKKQFTFAPLSAPKKSRLEKGESEGEIRKRDTGSLKIFEQLKVFPLLGEISKQYL